MTAVDVQVGDTIEWCQREITVLQIQRTRRLKRSGRWFTVEIDGRHVRLHWWDDETICLGRDCDPYVRAELPIAEARRLISAAAHLLAVDEDAKVFIPVVTQLLGCISTLQGYSDLLYQCERDRREGHVTSDPPVLRARLHLPVQPGDYSTCSCGWTSPTDDHRAGYDGHLVNMFGEGADSLGRGEGLSQGSPASAQGLGRERDWDAEPTLYDPDTGVHEA